MSAMDRDLLDRYITGWLARAHDHPERARTEWSRHGVALLPLGRRFSAVRLPGKLVVAAVGTTDAKAIAEELEFRLDGPVIHDSLAIGASAWLIWTAPVMTSLGGGTCTVKNDLPCGVSSMPLLPLRRCFSRRLLSGSAATSFAFTSRCVPPSISVTTIAARRAARSVFSVERMSSRKSRYSTFST